MNNRPSCFPIPSTKRYRLFFSIWGHNVSDSMTDFDTIEEVKEEEQMLKEFYHDTPRPAKVFGKNYDPKWRKNDYTWSFANGGCYWGYVILDYEKKEIVNIYGDGCRLYNIEAVRKGQKRYKFKRYYLTIDKFSDRRLIKDMFFREKDEIPSKYKWDDGEYEGWLQYRWGDGKNAINYIPAVSKIKNKPHEMSLDEEEKAYEEYISSSLENKKATIGDFIKSKNKCK